MARKQSLQSLRTCMTSIRNQRHGYEKCTFREAMSILTPCLYIHEDETSIIDPVADKNEIWAQNSNTMIVILNEHYPSVFSSQAPSHFRMELNNPVNTGYFEQGAPQYLA